MFWDKIAGLYDPFENIYKLKQAKKKLRSFNNVEFGKVDITAIDVADNSYDVVVAGNVIHLFSAWVMKRLAMKL